jgi:UMF1 family MFS transporter
MAFDWATQPIYTLGLTFIFAPYFAAVSFEYFSNLESDPDAARAASQSLWFWGQTIGGLFIAFTAPFIGAYADSSGRRMPWIWGFAPIYFIATFSLWWTLPDASTLFLMLILFNIAVIASEYSLIFVNAILPSLGNKDEIGRISGNGAALGYWGGVLSLIVMLLVFADNEDGLTLLGNAPSFGLDGSEREGTRVVGPLIAVWFAFFMIPFFAWVREPKTVNEAGGMGQALRDLKQCLINAYHRKSLFNFLVSSMLYRDALNALYAGGGIYATLVLGWETMTIGIFGIIGAITAAVATWIGGLFDSRSGPRPVITFCCWTLIFVCIIIVTMTRDGLPGLALADGIESGAIAGAIFGPTYGQADLIFLACGAIIGGAGGAIYASSRSMMVRHTHPDRPTEAFGLFALSGKATSFLAPLLISIFSVLTGNAQYGYIPVIILFVVGLYLLRFVHPEGDHAQWSDSAESQPS